MVKKDDKFTWGTGRRKTAVARVRLFSGSGKVTVNEIAAQEYFPVAQQLFALSRPFEVTGTAGKYDVAVNVHGGGKSAQSAAVVLGVARALAELNPEFPARLKEAHLMTRDSRMKERKKYGLRGARKGTQFSKR